MRKVIFIFIAIILVAASIDWIHSCSGLKSHKEVFGRELTCVYSGVQILGRAAIIRLIASIIVKLN